MGSGLFLGSPRFRMRRLVYSLVSFIFFRDCFNLFFGGSGSSKQSRCKEKHTKMDALRRALEMGDSVEGTCGEGFEGHYYQINQLAGGIAVRYVDLILIYWRKIRKEV